MTFSSNCHHSPFPPSPGLLLLQSVPVYSSVYTIPYLTRFIQDDPLSPSWRRNWWLPAATFIIYIVLVIDVFKASNNIPYDGLGGSDGYPILPEDTRDCSECVLIYE